MDLFTLFEYLFLLLLLTRTIESISGIQVLILI